ncbi:MAG: glycerol kinase GlpK, partial [Gammaproteobacteria bacterium]|nr:glycerol kinase GlpK [Gammaproteobacteria bacterium]
QVLGSAQQEFEQLFPAAGWVEHDPTAIWTSQLATARRALAEAGITADDLAAIGITNQRETVVLWDRASGQPMHNAIVWQDRRTAPACEALTAAGHAERLRQLTGLVIDPYFLGTKLAWLLDHVPDARARAAAGELAAGTIDSWLIWNLTAGSRHVTDETNASRTMLYNIHEHCWDPELLEILDVPAQLLPEVVDSAGVAAETTLLGGTRAVPVAGIAGDQQAALFGQACIDPGLAKTTYGTGCFMLMNTGSDALISRANLLTTVAWRIGGVSTYALEGSVFIGGAVVQWLRDGLGIIETAAESEALAASVADAGGVVFVPAFAGLGAPHWDAHARGLVVGITRGTTSAHLVRAALDSIAFQVCDLVDAMGVDAGSAMREIRVDGGAVSNDLLMQTQADLAGVPVVRAAQLESTAAGAAYLAGLGTGIWRDTAEIAALWQASTRFEPNLAATERSYRRQRWQDAVRRAEGWADASLNAAG